MNKKKSFDNEFNKKKILITGDTGFKGSWLAIWLIELGADIIGFALPPNSDPNNFHISNLANKINHVDGDIRKSEELSDLIQQTKPDLIFHLAAQSIVRESYLEPKITFETNIMGLVNLLESIKIVNHDLSVVVVTSDKCYLNQEWVWGYRESDPLGGFDPYSASKACAEIISSAYRSSFFNPDKMKNIKLATARAGDIIGGGDWGKDRLIPDLVRSINKNSTITLRNPEATRPWQHVLDPLAGYLLLGSKLAQNNLLFSSAWNFSNNDTENVNVEKLVKDFLKYWESKIKIEINRSQIHEAKMLQLDSRKTNYYLKWKPILSYNNTIAYTAEWYNRYYEKGENPHDICVDQINSYYELAEDMNAIWI